MWSPTAMIVVVYFLADITEETRLSLEADAAMTMVVYSDLT
jgi:hypothetical protein